MSAAPPQKRFTCIFCKSFKTNSEHHLSIHIKLQHPKHCNYCGKDFSTRKYLKKHIASVHEGKKIVVKNVENIFLQLKT